MVWPQGNKAMCDVANAAEVGPDCSRSQGDSVGRKTRRAENVILLLDQSAPVLNLSAIDVRPQTWRVAPLLGSIAGRLLNPYVNRFGSLGLGPMQRIPDKCDRTEYRPANLSPSSSQV